MKNAFYAYLQEKFSGMELIDCNLEMLPNQLLSHELGTRILSRFFNQTLTTLSLEEIPEEAISALAEEVRNLDCLDASLCFQISDFFFRLGEIYQRREFFDVALSKLKEVHSADPILFDAFSFWNLWGKILVKLATYDGEEEPLKSALEKFFRAEALLEQSDSTVMDRRELYWDWAEAWVSLGNFSNEWGDFVQGIQKFKQAEKLGVQLPHFQIDFGNALYQVGIRNGDPQLLRSAIEYFQKAIANCLQQGAHFPKAAFRKSWRMLVIASVKHAECSGKREDFLNADKVIHDGILALPEEADFWLEWGSLHLSHGWLFKSVDSFETALEKLTSSKIPFCNPIKVAALLCETLALLGVFLEDIRLLRDGERRILETLKLAPSHPALLYTKGLSLLGLGLYFSDERYLQQAIEIFYKGIEVDPRHVKLWQGIYQTYVIWGTQKKNRWILEKGLNAAERLAELQPFSPHVFSQWGVGLLRLYKLDPEDISSLEEGVARLRQALNMRNDPEEIDWTFHYACALDMLGDYYADETYFEEAIDLLSKILEKTPQAINVRYHLALAYAHYGEMALDCSSLHRSNDLFQTIIREDEEDDLAWCEWGYVLLHLSVMTEGSIDSQESADFRAQAETKLMRAAELGNGSAYYHLACLYSLSGLEEASINALRRADAKGNLPSLEELKQDEWLEEVRKSSSFQAFLEELPD